MFDEQKAKEIRTAINSAANGTKKLYEKLKVELEVAKTAEQFHEIADAIRKLIKSDPDGAKLTTVNTQIGKLMPDGWKKDGQRGKSQATIDQEEAGEAAARDIANGDDLRTDADGGRVGHIADTVGAYITAAIKTALADKPADKVGSTVVTVVRRTAKSDALLAIIANLADEYQKVKPTPANDAEQRTENTLASIAAKLESEAKPKQKRTRGRGKKATAKA